MPHYCWCLWSECVFCHSECGTELYWHHLEVKTSNQQAEDAVQWRSSYISEHPISLKKGPVENAMTIKVTFMFHWMIRQHTDARELYL